MCFCKDAEERGFSDLRQSDNSCLHNPRILAHPPPHSPHQTFGSQTYLLTNSISPCYVFPPTMTINTPPNNLAFELDEAMLHLSYRDETLRTLMAETVPSRIDAASAQSPHEVIRE